MAWYPEAVREPLTTRTLRPFAVGPVRINFHTAVSNTASLFTYWQTNTRGVYSHFYVDKEGTVRQYVDTKYRAVCDLQGNPSTISIETWDGYKSGAPGYWATNSDVPPWTEAQLVALGKLTAWLLETHPTIPNKLAISNRAAGTDSHGLSYHRLGVPGYARYTEDEGGLLYSLSVGKVCPGDRKVAQMGEILQLARGITPLPAKPAPTPPATGVNDWDGKSFPGASAFVVGQSHPAVTLLGHRLIAHGVTGYYKVGPGPKFGAADKAATADFQRRQGWTGSDADGIPGPTTWAKLMATPAPVKPIVSLSKLVAAFKTDAPKKGTPVSYRAVITVEHALVKEELLAAEYADGHAGTATRTAYTGWQKRCGYRGADANGIPGMESLRRLGKRHGFEVTA